VTLNNTVATLQPANRAVSLKCDYEVVINLNTNITITYNYRPVNLASLFVLNIVLHRSTDDLAATKPACPWHLSRSCIQNKNVIKMLYKCLSIGVQTKLKCSRCWKKLAQILQKITRIVCCSQTKNVYRTFFIHVRSRDWRILATGSQRQLKHFVLFTSRCMVCNFNFFLGHSVAAALPHKQIQIRWLFLTDTECSINLLTYQLTHMAKSLTSDSSSLFSIMIYFILSPSHISLTTRCFIKIGPLFVFFIIYSNYEQFTWNF